MKSKETSPGMLRARSVRKKDRKSTRLNSSHGYISYAVFCLKKKTPTATQVSFSHASLAINDSVEAALSRPLCHASAPQWVRTCGATTCIACIEGLHASIVLQ